MIISLSSLKVLAASVCIQMSLPTCPTVVDAETDPQAPETALAYFSPDRALIGFNIEAMREQRLQAREVRLLIIHEHAHAVQRLDAAGGPSHHGPEWVEIYHRYREL